MAPTIRTSNRKRSNSVLVSSGLTKWEEEMTRAKAVIVAAKRKLEELAAEAKEEYTREPEKLVGTLIRYTPKWKGTRGRAPSEVLSMVIGCRKVEEEKKRGSQAVVYHKVYVLDATRSDDPTSCTRIIRLMDNMSTWNPVSMSEWPNHTGLIGRRIVCLWPAKYSTPGNRKIQDDLKADKIPYDAFIIREVEDEQYKLLYTAEDSYYLAELEEEDEDWAFVHIHDTHYKGLPIICWSQAGHDAVDVNMTD